MPGNYLSSIFNGMQEFFKIASIIVFLRCFYDSRFQWNRKKAAFLLLATALFVLSFVLNASVISVLFYFFSLLALKIIPIYDYKGKRLIGFLRYECVYLLCQVLTSAISLVAAYYILPDFHVETTEISNNEELFKYIFCTLYFCVMFLLLHFGVYRRGLLMSCGRKYTSLMILYAFLLFVVFVVISAYEKRGRESFVILATAFILLTTVLPVFVYSLRISTHYQQRTKLQEIYMQSELEHFRQYMHAQEETRRFRHDIRNNLLCMNEMVSSGDNEKLTQYLKDLLEITDSLSFKYVSGDELLDSILNSKAQLMEQQGIRFELDGVLAGGLLWKPMDICAVFANALDNAIEACQKVAPDNRYISMSIKSTPQFWLVTIENPVAEVVDTTKLFQKNSGYTSKSDSARHGIGTYNMKHTVESYGANMNAECTKQAFKLEIMIDKSSS